MKVNIAYLYLIPPLLFSVSVSFYPLIRTFQLSFTHYDLTLQMEPQFVGLDNYFKLLNDDQFISSLRTTILFTFISVGAESIMGLIIALVLNEYFPGRSLARTILILPWGVPAVVEAQMWKFLFNDRIGGVNDILYKLGLISNYQAWLAEPFTAWMAIITAEVWATSIFIGLILLSELQSIPKHLYDAAKVDGAGRIGRFTYITLPLLKNAFMVALIFRTIQAFNAFDIIYVMTGGGPGGSTKVLSVYAYDTYFNFLNFGYGSAIAVICFLISLILAIIYLRMMKFKLD